MRIGPWQYSSGPGSFGMATMIDPTREALYITSVEEVCGAPSWWPSRLIIHAMGMILTQHFSNAFKHRIGRH